MLKDIQAEDLKIGMYVILPLAWHEHPFLKNHFLITSSKEIDQIRQTGLKALKIDLAKSKAMAEPPVSKESKFEETPKTNHVVVPDELRQVIHNKAIPPEEKARLIQRHSITMMSNLLANPTADTIKQAKQGITEVVDLILTDDDTPSNSLRLHRTIIILIPICQRRRVGHIPCQGIFQKFFGPQHARPGRWLLPP